LDAITVDGVTKPNPGANVGYKDYSVYYQDGDVWKVKDDDNYNTVEKRNAIAYGSGKAHATIKGGTVHVVYGGSNTKGNVRVESRATLVEESDCDFNVGDAYGGGNNAPMDGNTVLEAGCIKGMEKAYGGAANADVDGDVVLNITNGTYGQVFGGNDRGGAIRGSITVNIEETGCRPIIIGELYGGGNQAAYSVYGYDAEDNILMSGENPKNDPQVNVKSFTSIGSVYGGGYGEQARMVGNPTVNINVYQGKYCNTFNGQDNVVNDNEKVYGKYPVPSHAKGAIGAINNVFGGGNAAEVIGNPTVNIGTEAGEEVYAEVFVKEGESVADYYTRSGDGATEPYVKATGNAVAGTTYYLKTVKAADIRGNVYGGGNAAKVTGDTNVVIGKKKE